MNYVDLLLIIILIAAIWSGVQKGFILGLADLLCWLGSLVLAFLVYPYIVNHFNSQSIWTVFLCFITTLIVIRFLLGWITDNLLKQIPASAHISNANKIGGAVTGAVSGVLYAAIAATLLMLLPLSQGLTTAVQESKIALQLSEKFQKAESRIAPVLDDVNRSISKITIAPGSDKFIKLGFSVKDGKRRPDLESKMLELVNKERAAQGLDPLKADPEIALVALDHSEDMFSRGYFSHISPEGATPFDRLRKAEVSFLTAGENLALAQTLSLAHTGLMTSPGHRANILHKSFGRLGIGIIDGGIYGIMVTQNFRN